MLSRLLLLSSDSVLCSRRIPPCRWNELGKSSWLRRAAGDIGAEPMEPTSDWKQTKKNRLIKTFGCFSEYSFKQEKICTKNNTYGPRQANLCLRAFRHDKFWLLMPSHSEGPGIWLSVWRFLLIHCLYERAAEVLARLRWCAGSPEPSLLA